MLDRPTCWKGSVRQIAVALAGMILSGSVAARADTCFLPPTYVPGLYGPPNWTGAAASTSNSTGSWPTLHDPRWAGAPLQSFQEGDSSGTAGAVRVAAEGDYLYVSYHTLVDIPSDVDVVYFGFSLDSTTGSNAYVIEAQPITGSDPVTTDVGALWKKVGGTWSQSTDPNDWDDWLTDVVTWNNPDGLEWAINFKIKAKGAGGAGVSTGDFKVFFGLGLGITTGTDEGVVSYTTPAVPTTGSYIDNTVLQIPADTTNWLTAKALGTTCPAGVSLSSYDIATTTHPSGSNWLYTDGTDNVFHIKPKNVPGRAPQLANTVRAKMWVADWGSQIADPASSAWTPVYGADFNNSAGTWAWTWDTTAPSGPAVGSTDGVTISFTCAKESGATFCPKLTNVTSTETERHQCVLVELRGDPTVANSSHITFSKPAAYRNMEFQGLSTYSEEATISIQGLQAITGQAKDRDVYVYVKTDNMPKYGEEASWLPSKAMAEARRYAEHPPQAPAPAQPDGKRDADARAKAAAAHVKGAPASVPPAPAADGKTQFPDEDEVLALPVLSPAEAMATVWPTYQVFAYYDTGNTITAKGKKRKILKAMVPFGYHFSHDGPHYGFSHSLTPVGTSWTEVAPNLYKVNIPNEGKIKVRVNVTAHEIPRSKCQQCDGTLPPIKVIIKPRCYCALPGADQGSTYGALIALLMGTLALWTRRRSR